MKSNKEEFIAKAKIVHLNENLDYSESVYVNNRTPLKIIDHDLDENGIEYGEFWQTPYNHLRGQCHPRKRGQKISLAKRGKEEEIIARFKEVHKGENLDYSQVHYVNMHTKVKIISHDLRPDGTEYGEFWQEPVVHLKGCSHPDMQHGAPPKYNTQIFIEKAQRVQSGSPYSYEYVDYKGSTKKIKIYCNYIGKNGKPHGEFLIRPDSFLQGKGCPICGRHLSIAENEIYNFLVKYLGEDAVIRRNKTVLDGKELDLYVPSLNIAFEYNGLRWHTEEFAKGSYYHLNKTLKCKERGINLIHIFEDEYINHKEIVLNKILHIIGQNNGIKVGARKCTAKDIGRNEANVFLSKNHIQGYVASTVYEGLFYEDELIAVMSFTTENNGKWNLTRFATNGKYICQGGASKLLSFFIKKYNPQEIKSFLDRRWVRDEKSNVYIKLGFHFKSYVAPDYRYFNGTIERIHKFNFRKQILHKKYGLPLSMTESEMAKELGYHKIWDCGLIKYVWTKNGE